MLVLSRHRDEKVEIQVPGLPPIILTVVDIRGDKVRLGIEAPPDIPVHRSEVANAIRRENEKASTQTSTSAAVIPADVAPAAGIAAAG